MGFRAQCILPSVKTLLVIQCNSTTDNEISESLHFVFIVEILAVGLTSAPLWLFSRFRRLKMETWRRWRRRSGWKNANAKDVRTRTPAERTEARRPRRDVDDRQQRSCPPTRPNSPSKWTPSLIQWSTTETGEEIIESFRKSCKRKNELAACLR